MNKKIDRRQFIKFSTAGAAALAMSGKVPGLGVGEARAAAQTHTFEFAITDAIKEMHTHVQKNNATCYFWLYRWDRFNGFNAPRPNAEVPGPNIYVTEGDTVTFNITNRLDEPHTLSIPALGFNNAGNPVPANGGTRSYSFVVPSGKAGAYLYYDNLSVVNRVMGLHGAFVVMEAGAFADPTGLQSWSRYPWNAAIMAQLPNVKALYDVLGAGGSVASPANPYPGLAWHQGAGVSGDADYTPPFRRHIWLEHHASPVLFEEVGRSAPGDAIRNPVNFLNALLTDPFIATSNDGRANTPKLDRFNRKSQFFTVCGQSGHFAHNNATVVPMHRVGEPCMITILNAGVMTFSHHLHCNHFYLLAVGSVDQPVAAADFRREGVSDDNPIWIDVYQIHPMTRVEWLVPYMKPPDIPNLKGIGLADTPLLATDNPPFPGFPGGAAHPVWPPTDEFTLHHPPVGTIRKNFLGTGKVDIAQRQSPLCYPAHDHSEPSQTSQGGNYNTGLIGGQYVIGDRNTPGAMNFPMDEDFAMMLSFALGTIGQTAPAAGPDLP